MPQYLFTHDGGQCNIPVETISRQSGLNIVRGLTSDLVGWLGNDGNIYTLAHDDELHDEPVFTNNVVPLR